MANTSLATQQDIAFISTHLSAEHCASPASEDGQLILALQQERNAHHAVITEIGPRLFETLSQASGAARYLGIFRVNASTHADAHPGTIEHSIRLLDCDLWQRFFDSTTMKSVLPTRLAEDFRKKIAQREVPPFTNEHVLPTVKSWFASQYQFIAERIDGVFHALSDTHITNSPAGFGKKMIMKNATGLHSKTSVASHIDDLRIAISSLEGRASWLDKSGLSTSKVLDMLYRKGQFDVDHELDGGALMIRIFKVGTVHLYVHPDVAYKLNDILAMLYPAAIPAKFRKQPAVRERMFKPTINKTLPVGLLSPVIQALSKAIGRKHDRIFLDSIRQDLPLDAHIFSLSSELSRYAGFDELMQALGASLIPCQNRRDNISLWMVRYDPRNVALDLAQNGQIPDKKSHQFYPTVEQVGRDAAAMLLNSHTPGLSYLEPSVGQGDLLKLLPSDGKSKITAVEISSFQLAIAQGVRSDATFIGGDFVSFAQNAAKRNQTFDRILMNPPYTNGQDLYHTQLAAALLSEGGQLVAILPNSLRHHHFPGYEATRSEPYTNAFADTNITVFILKLNKKSA